MMLLIDQLAEQKIREAIDKGELDNLPGMGKPLVLEDLSMVPKELRAGYLMLKNAGYVPPEVSHLKELNQVEQLIRQASSAEERSGLNKRINYLRLCLEKSGINICAQNRNQNYQDRLIEKIAQDG